MNPVDTVQYLANILLVGAADDRVNVPEGRAIETILRSIGATVDDLEEAAGRIHQGTGEAEPTGRLSFRVRNLEDMVLVAIADGKAPPEEKAVILDFAKKIGMRNEQLREITAEARERVKGLG